MEYYNFENSETFENPKYRTLFKKVIKALIKPQREKLSERLHLEDENERKRILWKIIKKYNPKRSEDEIFTAFQMEDWTWDIEQVKFDYKGESNWEEKSDIPIKVPQTGEVINWCSNWNDTAETTKIVTEWQIEYASNDCLNEDVDIEQKLFDEIKEILFPDKKHLTTKDWNEVLDKHSELIEAINDLIPELINEY